jgi:DNA-binding response OmpR family regulator
VSEIGKPIKADQILHKPVEPDILLKTIERFVSRRRSQ